MKAFETRRRRTAWHTLQVLICLAFFSAAWVLQAQDFERVAPKTPTMTPATTAVPPTVPSMPAAEEPGGEELVVNNLTGIVFVSSKAEVRPDGVAVTGIHIKGMDLLNQPEFTSRMERYLRLPLPLKDLRQMVREVAQYCREKNRPVASVLVPEQDVTAGAIQVAVLEGGDGEISDLASSDDTVIVKMLKGIVFVSSKAEIRAAAISSTGIQTNEIEPIDSPKFIAQMERYLGKPLTTKGLGPLVREVVMYCRGEGHPVVNVIVPGQDVTTGVIQVVLVEGKVGEVRAQGNRWFRSKLLTGQVKLYPGERIRSKPLLRDMVRLNSNPFRSVEVAFTPGKRGGDVDLELRTVDRFPVRVFSGYEDTGSDATGDERIVAGFNWGNAFGLDHQFNYQAMGDARFKKISVHSGSYIAPLPWGNRLTWFGFYQNTRPDTDLTPAIQILSDAWQSSLRYNQTLPQIGDYVHEAVAGFDLKQTVSQLRVGGLLGFNQTSDVVQWMLGYNSGYRDSWGRTAFGGSAFVSPGGLSKYNTDAHFRAQRAFAGADYTYLRLTLERVTNLPYDFSWIVRGTYQVSPGGNLLPSEQLAVGGFQSVRGYDERLVGGDEGYLIANEWWTPPVSFATWLGQLGLKNQVRDRFQALWFLDYGVAENTLLLPGEDPSVALMGAGPGFRYSISPYLSVRADYGMQLKDAVDSGFPSRHNSRWHVGVVMSY